ncbi:MAG: hypothetical protein IPG66_16430 [Hydrogenophilales bacterium]|jgi:hypothetical protein|nr:hypothetical protein [Hydrogenophilales bacterium]
MSNLLMVSGVFWIWQLLALTGSVKQRVMTVLFMVSGRSSAFVAADGCARNFHQCRLIGVLSQ